MMRANRKSNLSRSERKAAYREETERVANKEAEQCRLQEAEKKAAIKKKNKKILLYTFSILLVLFVAGGYYGKAREVALKEYIETDPAITTVYVYRVHHFGQGAKCYISYHYYVDGNRFDMDDINHINNQWRWFIIWDCEEAHCGDSIIIKYRRGNPEKHIITGILR